MIQINHQFFTRATTLLLADQLRAQRERLQADLDRINQELAAAMARLGNPSDVAPIESVLSVRGFTAN